METTPQSNRWLPLTSPPTSPAAVTEPDPLTELATMPEKMLPLTISTQASSTASLTKLNGMAHPLTPPTTPEKPTDKRISTDSRIETLTTPSSDGTKRVPAFEGDDEVVVFEIEDKPLEKVPEEPQAYSKKYHILEELGQGAWSNVYSAIEQTENLAPSVVLPLSPPISPESKVKSRQAHILAVKKPSERMAHKVLKKEACILTYLHSRNEARSYIVPFHGFDVATHTIAMDAVPTTLEALVKSSPCGEFSTKTMYDPIIGAETWATIARQLIDGLAFLQDVGCIHGDIKPANILINSDNTSGKVTPLYCDFSSARVESPNTPASETEEITAVTKDYTSPELLLLLLGRNNDRAIATSASDVFALAVTLLAAAIGGSPYANVQMEIQKLSMAKEGLPIEFARQGANGSRVMKGRAVAKILGPAVKKVVEERITVKTWKQLAKTVLLEWKEAGWTRGG